MFTAALFMILKAGSNPKGPEGVRGGQGMQGCPAGEGTCWLPGSVLQDHQGREGKHPGAAEGTGMQEIPVFLALPNFLQFF